MSAAKAAGLTGRGWASGPASRQQPRPGGRVVVGVDDTPGGVEALRWAAARASASGSELVAVRAWALGLPGHGGRRRHQVRIHPHVVLSFDGAEQRVASAVMTRRVLRAALGRVPAGLTVTIETPEGEPGSVLAATAAAGDVLVLGGRPGHRLAHLIHGSVSRYCGRHACCPVVTVPARTRHTRPTGGEPGNAP